MNGEEKIFFICANCEKKTYFSSGVNITLICQSCGCSDIYFSTEVKITLLYSEENNLSKIIAEKEPFFGITPQGAIWKVEISPKKTESDFSLEKIINGGMGDSIPPLEKDKTNDKVEETNTEDSPQSKPKGRPKEERNIGLRLRKK